MSRGGVRANSGRRPFSPTDIDKKQVKTLSGHGIPLEQIGALIRDGISAPTLVKYFERELIVGRAEASAKIGKVLFEKAILGDTKAAIWWTKTQMRWSETHQLEHRSPDRSISPSLDVSKLSNSALAEILNAQLV